jgi:hypothetical protein
VDAYLAVASNRDQREYAERPVPKDSVERILDRALVRLLKLHEWLSDRVEDLRPVGSPRSRLCMIRTVTIATWNLWFMPGAARTLPYLLPPEIVAADRASPSDPAGTISPAFGGFSD